MPPDRLVRTVTVTRDVREPQPVRPGERMPRWLLVGRERVTVTVTVDLEPILQQLAHRAAQNRSGTAYLLEKRVTARVTGRERVPLEDAP